MKRYKQAFPIIIYVGSWILYTISGDDFVFQILSLILVFSGAVCMSINIWRLEPIKRKQCAWGELLFCIMTFLAGWFLPRFIGNILSSVCIVIIACVYMFAISPKLFQRKIL